jgi:thioredoxin 1
MRKPGLGLCIALAAMVVAGCGGGEKAGQEGADTSGTGGLAAYATPMKAASRSVSGLPRVVDLGRGQCVPCKMMAPILEELAREYRGRALIEVVDIGDKPEAVKEYGMKVMPTQVFFDAQGNEVWRHEGFLAKEKIVEKLAEMGVEPSDG